MSNDSFENEICSLAPNSWNGQKQAYGHDVHASKIRTIILNPNAGFQIVKLNTFLSLVDLIVQWENQLKTF